MRGRHSGGSLSDTDRTHADAARIGSAVLQEDAQSTIEQWRGMMSASAEPASTKQVGSSAPTPRDDMHLYGHESADAAAERSSGVSSAPPTSLPAPNPAPNEQPGCHVREWSSLQRAGCHAPYYLRTDLVVAFDTCLQHLEAAGYWVALSPPELKKLRRALRTGASHAHLSRLQSFVFDTRTLRCRLIDLTHVVPWPTTPVAEYESESASTPARLAPASQTRRALLLLLEWFIIAGYDQDVKEQEQEAQEENSDMEESD